MNSTMNVLTTNAAATFNKGPGIFPNKSEMLRMTMEGSSNVSKVRKHKRDASDDEENVVCMRGKVNDSVFKGQWHASGSDAAKEHFGFEYKSASSASSSSRKYAGSFVYQGRHIEDEMTLEFHPIHKPVDETALPFQASADTGRYTVKGKGQNVFGTYTMTGVYSGPNADLTLFRRFDKVTTPTPRPKRQRKAKRTKSTPAAPTQPQSAAQESAESQESPRSTSQLVTRSEFRSLIQIMKEAQEQLQQLHGMIVADATTNLSQSKAAPVSPDAASRGEANAFADITSTGDEATETANKIQARRKKTTAARSKRAAPTTTSASRTQQPSKRPQQTAKRMKRRNKVSSVSSEKLDLDKVPLSTEEMEALAKKIQELSEDNMVRALEIIRESSSASFGEYNDEVELDMEELDVATQRKLQHLVNATTAPSKRPLTQVVAGNSNSTDRKARTANHIGTTQKEIDCNNFQTTVGTTGGEDSEVKVGEQHAPKDTFVGRSFFSHFGQVGNGSNDHDVEAEAAAEAELVARLCWSVPAQGSKNNTLLSSPEEGEVVEGETLKRAAVNDDESKGADFWNSEALQKVVAQKSHESLQERQVENRSQQEQKRRTTNVGTPQPSTGTPQRSPERIQAEQLMSQAMDITQEVDMDETRNILREYETTYHHDSDPERDLDFF